MIVSKFGARGRALQQPQPFFRQGLIKLRTILIGERS